MKADDLQPIYFAGGWQAVLDAVRAESQAEIERLTQRVKDCELVAVEAIAANA